MTTNHIEFGVTLFINELGILPSVMQGHVYLPDKEEG